jgi:hypothetical protein
MACIVCAFGMASPQYATLTIQNDPPFSVHPPTVPCIVVQQVHQSAAVLRDLISRTNQYVLWSDAAGMVGFGAPPPPNHAAAHPIRNANNTHYIQNSFAPNEVGARNRLGQILATLWWQGNTLEHPRDIFDLFIGRQAGTLSFICRFLSCGHKAFARLDRVKAHIRWHLALRPFACRGNQAAGCGSPGWWAPFPSNRNVAHVLYY